MSSPTKAINITPKNLTPKRHLTSSLSSTPTSSSPIAAITSKQSLWPKAPSKFIHDDSALFETLIYMLGGSTESIDIVAAKHCVLSFQNNEKELEALYQRGEPFESFTTQRLVKIREDLRRSLVKDILNIQYNVDEEEDILELEE